MGEFSISHVLILTLILLIFFGPSRLPALGQSIGKAIRGFKDGMNETENELNKSVHNSSSSSQSTQQISQNNQNPMTQTTDEKNRQNNS
jgi:TatA/E family protein of Tat protein translocase